MSRATERASAETRARRTRPRGASARTVARCASGDADERGRKTRRGRARGVPAPPDVATSETKKSAGTPGALVAVRRPRGEASQLALGVQAKDRDDAGTIASRNRRSNAFHDLFGDARAFLFFLPRSLRRRSRSAPAPSRRVRPRRRALQREPRLHLRPRRERVLVAPPPPPPPPPPTSSPRPPRVPRLPSAPSRQSIHRRSTPSASSRSPPPRPPSPRASPRASPAPPRTQHAMATSAAARAPPPPARERPHRRRGPPARQVRLRRGFRRRRRSSSAASSRRVSLSRGSAG